MTIKSLAYTTSTDANGVVTETAVASDMTMTEVAVAALATPFGVTAPETEFVSKKLAAISSIGYASAGVFLGEAWGHKRSMAGKTAFIPVFR